MQTECEKKYGVKNWRTFTIQGNNLTVAQSDLIESELKKIISKLNMHGVDMLTGGEEAVTTYSEGEFQ